MSMDRREVFRILTASVVAAGSAAGQHRHGAFQVPADYQPRFLTVAEYAALNALCAIIMPADEHSPGAHEVGVPFYIDTVLHYADTPAKQAWRAGLTVVDQEAKNRFDRPFAQCRLEQQDAVVAKMAENEGQPRNDLQRFFAPLKRLITDAYCFSDEARAQWLGYTGDKAVGSFPGCTHPEHQS